MFEGDADMFWRSLLRLRGLPPATRVFCGHDYAVENLRFALDVEPGHGEAAAALDEALAVRRAGLVSVPFDLGPQRRLNPFLRCDDPALAAALFMPRAAPADVFAALRRRKDGF
jgi:hydroxyacylglutathione hydrolase